MISVYGCDGWYSVAWVYISTKATWHFGWIPSISHLLSRLLICKSGRFWYFLTDVLLLKISSPSGEYWLSGRRDEKCLMLAATTTIHQVQSSPASPLCNAGELAGSLVSSRAWVLHQTPDTKHQWGGWTPVTPVTPVIPEINTLQGSGFLVHSGDLSLYKNLLRCWDTIRPQQTSDSVTPQFWSWSENRRQRRLTSDHYEGLNTITPTPLHCWRICWDRSQIFLGSWRSGLIWGGLACCNRQVHAWYVGKQDFSRHLSL